MTTLKTTLIGAVVIAGLTASLVIQHQAKVKLHEIAVLLRQQDSQRSELAAEHERMSDQVALTDQAVANPAAELAKLRNDAESLRKLTKELGKMATENRQWTRSEASSILDSKADSSVSSDVVSDSNSEEYKVQLYKLACAAPHSFPLTNGWTMNAARNLSRAVRFYAREHQGEFPSNFDQAADYYYKDQPLPRVSDFELVFQGSQKDLTNIPDQAVALLRERQAWQTPNGKWGRIYVMAGGEVKVVESEDNFQSWEAEHVIPPPVAGLK